MSAAAKPANWVTHHGFVIRRCRETDRGNGTTKKRFVFFTRLGGWSKERTKALAFSSAAEAEEFRQSASGVNLLDEVFKLEAA